MNFASLASAPVSSSGPWSLGVLIGLPVLIVVTLLLVGFAAFAFSESEVGIAVGTLFAAVVILGIAASPLGYYPYDSEYHQWRTVHGTVQTVSSRMIAADKAMSQRFVVQIDGQPFGIDDTRASLIKAGDTVTLRCKREWQYAADSGWACRWGGSK
jgi:hypothetical protein